MLSGYLRQHLMQTSAQATFLLGYEGYYLLKQSSINTFSIIVTILSYLAYSSYNHQTFRHYTCRKQFLLLTNNLLHTPAGMSLECLLALIYFLNFRSTFRLAVLSLQSSK